MADTKKGTTATVPVPMDEKAQLLMELTGHYTHWKNRSGDFAAKAASYYERMICVVVTPEQ